MQCHTRRQQPRFAILPVRQATIEEYLRELAAGDPLPDPRASLAQLALAYRRSALANPALYALMFERAILDFTPSHAARTASLAPFDMLVAAIRRCHVGQHEASRVAYLFWCALHGLVSIELTHRRWGGPVVEHLQRVDAEQAFWTGAQAILDGLLAQPPDVRAPRRDRATVGGLPDSV